MIEEKGEFFAGSSVRDAVVSVTAEDTFTSKTIDLQINVQNPIYDFDIYTKPSNTLVSNEG